MYIGSVDGSQPVRLLAAETAAAYAPPGYLLLVSQGVLVAHRFDLSRGQVGEESIPVVQAVGAASPLSRGAFSVSGAGVLAVRGGAAIRRQLVWVDRSGKSPEVLVAPGETGFADLELRPDGRHVAATGNAQGNDVWLIEVARGIANRFTLDTAVDRNPVWSPDGSLVVFASNRNGRFDLFEKPSNGDSDEQPLLVTGHNKAPQDWSTVGQILLYAIDDPKTASDLWALPLVGERTPFPVVQTSSDDVQGQFSPDGRWVAYASNETGRYEIYVRPFPGLAGRRQISSGGGIYPRWRRDGRELFYLTPDNRLIGVPVTVAPLSSALELGAPVALFPTRIATGAGTSIGGIFSRAQYAVASNGRFLMNVSAEDTSASPISVVLNWEAALKK